MNGMNVSITKKWLSAVLVLMLALLAACGGGNAGKGGESGNVSPTPTATVEPTSEAQATAEPVYPLTVTDATGTQITFEQAPQSIVTLVPSETETIFAIGAGHLVVGVDEHSNYPEEAASIAKVGDMATNIEAVAALNPDLVLASSSMNGDAVAKLRELNLNVYATAPKTYDEVIAKIVEIGKIVNMPAEASEVADRMRQVKQQVEDTVKDAEKRKVYLEFSEGWTVGSGEFMDELLTIAGGINVAGGQSGWFEVNAEEIVQQNPQVIIYPDYGEEKSSIVAAIEKRPGWETIDAVKNGRLVKVTNDPLVRVGPRLADGLLEMAKAVHPELFE